ncbi:MAG: group II intron reverse transcriptase/maturase [Proteobacteria bacterium]|nr:group II intron reverse transcriptase/maturase [Pseudomonadota bacterium]
MSRAQKWQPICPQLRRVQERARANRDERFTSLAHYLTEAALLRAYKGLRAKAAAGPDGETKASYGKGLKHRLKRLHTRLKSGTYRATPAKRIYLDKPDGSQRPINLQVIEDKIVQRAVVEILNCIYEVDFRSCSYGFRPGRSQHQALQSLQTVLQKGHVNWVLDLDLKACFDRIDHAALMAVIEKRVNDKTLLRLIRKWLTVGYREEREDGFGKRQKQRRGTPQGAVISPLLSNIVLNEAMDRFVHQWRQEKARGEVYIVRFADDAVLSFEHQSDALALQVALERNLQCYGLELNQAKTQLIRFGRNHPPTGSGGSESFDFLGLTHFVGKDRNGRYLVKRKTARKRLHRNLQKIKVWCRQHRHKPLAWQWQELSVKLRGHYAYYGIRGNSRSLAQFRYQTWKYWRQCLRKRSQTGRKDRLTRLLNERFILPLPKITHPDNWLPVNPGYLLGRAGCGKSARPVL